MDVRPGFRIAVAAAAVVLAVGCSSNDSTGSTGDDAQPSSDAPASNPGLVFDGTYEAVQVPEDRPDVPPTPPEYRTTTLSVKSFCANDSGPCVASALLAYPNVVPAPAPQPLVLDYVDGQWIYNLPSMGTCATLDGVALQAPQWQVAAFEQPEGVEDGSLIAGIGTTHAGPPCANDYATTYTFTRTGPLDPAMNVPPPDEVPALVEAAGSALSGTYDFAFAPLSATDGLSVAALNETGRYTSSCTRTGEQCVSVFDAESDVLPMLEWSGGAWSSDATYASAACANGSGEQQTTIRASFTNDDPGATTAQALTGEVQKIYSGDCPGEVAWTVTATRTGD